MQKIKDWGKKVYTQPKGWEGQEIGNEIKTTKNKQEGWADGKVIENTSKRNKKTREE